MISFVNKYARNLKFSQNGEEGLLITITRRLGIEKGHAVEIGAHNGHFCSNTAFLIQGGWSGKFVEADYNLYLDCGRNWKDYLDLGVTVQCSYVDGGNVNAFVDDSCDLLSLDTDGGDYEIFKGLKAKPKIVIVEIDSSIPPDQVGFNADGGAGYWSMTELGLQKGYFLLAHTGNLVLVDEQYKHLFPEISSHPLLDYEEYFNRGWLKEAA